MFTHQYRMFKKSLAMRGLVQTLVYAIQWPLVSLRENRQLRERTVIQTAFDNLHGTDTSGIISLSSFSIANPVWKHGVRYAPTSPASFSEALSLLPFQKEVYSTFTFVDVGSGKGATLLYAGDAGFKAVFGIELVEKLNAIAIQNLLMHPSTKLIGQSLCMDAALFKMPIPPLIVFANYPFSSKSLMQKVIRNVSDSGSGPKYFIACNYPYDPSELPDVACKPIVAMQSSNGRSHYCFEVK